MNLSDKIELGVSETSIDENLNEVSQLNWIDLGKCLITPNSSASRTIGNDGKEYIYSYEIIMRKPKTNIPKENDMIHFVKKDGTIDKTCRVSGFVTLRNWMKIWV